MDLTGGQPWLVNALANEVTDEMREFRDRTRSIGVEDIEVAKERLILARATHLDQLLDKLKEDRVRRVIEPILQSEEIESAQFVPEDDILYVADLGLISLSST
jgi:cell division protein ZapA (FtsZ GTPase activity inhibitor)